jgi:hypothetical protein
MMGQVNQRILRPAKKFITNNFFIMAAAPSSLGKKSVGECGSSGSDGTINNEKISPSEVVKSTQT